MSKAQRLSETWFRRGLWVVALLFAWFLSGLGSVLVGDLPRVEQNLTLEQMLDPDASAALQEHIRSGEQTLEDIRDALQRARLRHQSARADTEAARDNFNNWITTRRATARPDQDPELIQRTAALDALKDTERAIGREVEALQQQEHNARYELAQAQQQLNELEQEGIERLQDARRQQELRVFLYRLLLTLPLLVIAGWLFVRKRNSTYWPFAWGFILFALFTFFIELVPYLPSYGGYVRYSVGILITVLAGRQAILALNRYLEQQRLRESLPDEERRRELGYDLALTRLTKGVCPGCERHLDLNSPTLDFCPHCGIGLHNQCRACNTRKSAFSRFCHCCGAPS